MEEKIYHVGIYLRLSREDGDSDSIHSQKELACAFVQNHSDMEIYGFYSDDGYSGACFDNRPQFQRMMEDVRAGRVDCVIVKDLSRLGRDYIEAGRLIQKTFPAFRVRFIAITDHYDSLTADANETTLVIPIKNFVNDSYCRDISFKVRSHQKVKWAKGEFIGAFAVYGYVRDVRDKHRLKKDPYASLIVQHIFAWRMDGMSSRMIAGRLNEMGILSPMEYKKSKGENYYTGFAQCGQGKWSAMAVQRILKDEVYCGTLMQGKSEKINYKLNQRIKKAKEEWVRVEHAHELVIAAEDFHTVQRLLSVNARALGGMQKAHAFSGILFCANCMSPMVRRVNVHKGKAQVAYVCGASNRQKGRCSRHTVLERDLNAAVQKTLALQRLLFLDQEHVSSDMAQLGTEYGEAGQFRQEALRMRKVGEKYDAMKEGLSEDFQSGMLSAEDYEDFLQIYKARQAWVQEAAKKQEELLQCISQRIEESRGRLSRLRLSGYTCLECGRESLLAFFRRILVYEDKRICLELKNRGIENKRVGE